MSEVDILCKELAIEFSWICCLNPIEAIPMNFLIAIRAGGLVEFVTKSAFDAVWTAQGDPVDSPRYKQFVYVYELRLETVDFDGTMVEVYMLDSDFWFKMLLWFGCEQFGCADGCFERKYSLG